MPKYAFHPSRVFLSSATMSANGGLGAAGQFPDAVFEFVDGFVGHLQSCSVRLTVNPETCVLLGDLPRFFSGFTCESQCVTDEACHASHDPLTCCFCF